MISRQEFLSMVTVAGGVAKATYPAAQQFATFPGDNAQPRHVLFPIPDSELSVNKAMKQSPEWLK